MPEAKDATTSTSSQTQMKIYESSGSLHFLNYSIIHNELPVGNYTLKFSPTAGFYLQKDIDFSIPTKLYGDLEKDADFYIDAFNRSNKNLGIVLNGEKGSGKTLLSALICKRLNLPVVKIEDKFAGGGFISFINEIKQHCVVLIDEYDKIYPRYSGYSSDEEGDKEDPQVSMLRLLDGGSVSKKFFIFTSNELTLSSFMINRPSRIRYRQTFEKLSDTIVSEVLNDKLKEENKKFIPDFLVVSNVFFGFNLDTLLTIVDEVNNHSRSPKELIKRMNIVPETNDFSTSLVEPDGKTYEGSNFYGLDLTSMQTMQHQYFYNKKVNRHDPEEREDLKIIREISYEPISCFQVVHTDNQIVYKHIKEKYSIVFKPLIGVKSTYLF